MIGTGLLVTAAHVAPHMATMFAALNVLICLTGTLMN